MITIYIDNYYKCHLADDGTRQAIETDFFDGKCQEYIEGYRLVPAGAVWTRSDGVEFRGEMIAPWKPWEELDAIQRAYEREQYDTLTAQLAALDAEYEKGVNSL